MERFWSKVKTAFKRQPPVETEPGAMPEAQGAPEPLASEPPEIVVVSPPEIIRPLPPEGRILNAERYRFGSGVARLMGARVSYRDSTGILNAERFTWISTESRILNADRYAWKGPWQGVLNAGRYRWKPSVFWGQDT